MSVMQTAVLYFELHAVNNVLNVEDLCRESTLCLHTWDAEVQNHRWEMPEAHGSHSDGSYGT